MNKSNPKILMLIANFYPRIGGGERQAQKLSSTLIRYGFKVTVLTGSHGRYPKNDQIENIPIVRTRIRFFIFKLISLRNRYDIIHVHLGYEPAVMAVIVAWLLGKKCIVKIGNSDEKFDFSLLLKKTLGPIYLWILKKGLYKVISISKPISKNILDAGFSGTKLVEIPNGVYTVASLLNKPNSLKSELGFDSGVEILVYLGRLIEAKNIMGLLKSWKIVLGKMPDHKLKLLIIGEGEQGAEAQMYSERNNLQNTVEFLGNIKNVNDYLSVSDSFILPSFIEGLSNALLEAMSFRLHCLVSDIPANKEFINENCVTAFNPKDYNDIAEKIIDSFKNKQKFELTRQNAIKKIERSYSMEKITQMYIKLYTDLYK